MHAWASLGALAGSLWPLRASLAASDRSLEVPRAPKVERQGRPGEPDKPFLTIWGRFWLHVYNVFRSFLTCHGTGDLTRCAQGRTFVFAGRRSTLEGSQARQKHAKSRNSIEHCLDDASRASRVPDAHRFPSRARLSLAFRRPGALPDAPRRSF